MRGLLLLLLAGCSLATPYTQRDPLPLFSQYGTTITEQLATEGIPADDAVDRVRRNQLIRELIWVIDAEYNDYESSLYVSTATLNTLTDWMVLGATGAAAALSAGGSTAAPSILSAGAAALTGARASVQENFFQQHGRVALIATMRALRADALVALTKGMRLAAASYPMSRAMVDLQTYANAGSLLTAMQSIANTATDSMGKSEVELKRVKSEEP